MRWSGSGKRDGQGAGGASRGDSRGDLAPEGGPAASEKGAAAEDRALAHLERQGLRLVQRNYRVAGGPSRPAGEIDLIMRDRDGTLVFVEVRARSDGGHGGAAASVNAAKRRHIVRAAQHFLLRWRELPPCRFDVVALDGDELRWLPAAFDAGGY